MSPSTPTVPLAPRVRQGRLVHDWVPEDNGFWARKGWAVARRNLALSVPALFLAFAIWQVWSVVAVSLPGLGFHYSTNQLFWLAAAPALSGATLRIFFAFMVPVLGGRRWTALSTASLLIPAVGIGLAVQDNNTGYPTMLALALLCGLGGGHFSASMAHVGVFFPQEKRRAALGLNAGLGQLGVPAVQLLTPLVIAAGLFGALGGEAQHLAGNGAASAVWVQNAAFVWVPFIALAAVAAWFGMNDVADARVSFAAQAAIFRRRHNWLMCLLYLGCFGSFIGYAAGFPLLISSQFPGVDPLAWAWIGPLLGALMRPVGGWLADRLGAARVTCWSFAVMAPAVAGVLHFLPTPGQGGSFAGFFAAFMLLFMASGLGNGSTLRMVPALFLHQALRSVDRGDAAAVARATRDGHAEGAAALAFTAAIGAYGGFFIPKSYGTSINLTGGPEAALLCFAGYYVLCAALTWWCCSRRDAPMPC